MKDRTFPIVINKASADLVINEFVAMGSVDVNEFGVANDWFEIYNNSDKSISIKNNEWYVSNDASNLEKFALPAMKINAKQFVTIWCDALDTVATSVHTNFKLSAAGSSLLLNQKSNNIDIKVIDNYSYGQQQSAISTGRYPDGNSSWITFTSPTPGNPNQ
jgi:Lamin Tail Domain